MTTDEGLSGAELEQVMESSKSYVGAAVVVCFLYPFFILPGFIFNWMWLTEAQKTQRATGRAPSGMGCLVALFWFGGGQLLIVAAFLAYTVVSIVGSSKRAAESGMSVAESGMSVAESGIPSAKASAEPQPSPKVQSAPPLALAKTEEIVPRVQVNWRRDDDLIQREKAATTGKTYIALWIEIENHGYEHVLVDPFFFAVEGDSKPIQGTSSLLLEPLRQSNLRDGDRIVGALSYPVAKLPMNVSLVFKPLSELTVKYAVIGAPKTTNGKSSEGR